MKIAVPKEIKNHEYRVALTPTGARELAGRGHQVSVQAGAGEGAGFDDADYQAAGAQIEADVEVLWRNAELILKVKEPQPDEVARPHPAAHAIYLSASGRRRASDPWADGERCHLHRL